MITGATPPVTDQGWLYDLLRWAGVSAATSAHWQQVVIKPLTAIAILLVAMLISRLGARVIRRWVAGAARRATAKADSPRATARALTLTSLLANIWRVVVYVVAFFVILGTIGVNLTPLLAGATVIGATLGFGAQAIVRDVLAGFLLTIEGQFDIGDSIMVGDTAGTVEDLTLRVTRMRSHDGTVWFVPNGEIRKLANASRGWAQAEIDTVVPAAASVDTVLETARQAAVAVAQDPRYSAVCLEEPRVWGVVAAASDSFTCRVSLRTPTLERDRIARAVREETLRRLGSIGVYTAPAVGAAGAGATPAGSAPPDNAG